MRSLQDLVSQMLPVGFFSESPVCLAPHEGRQRFSLLSILSRASSIKTGVWVWGMPAKLMIWDFDFVPERACLKIPRAISARRNRGGSLPLRARRPPHT